MLLTGDLENEDKDKEHSISLQSPNTNISFYLAYFFICLKNFDHSM